MINPSFLILSSLICGPFATTFSTDIAWGRAPIRVTIDPGHGGDDDGTVRKAPKGVIKEKEITLKIAQELERILEKDRNFKPFMTRTSDVFVSLEGRSQKALENKADVFVSIHVNSSPAEKARGAEFYFQNQVPTDEESLLVANRENAARSTKAQSRPQGQPSATPAQVGDSSLDVAMIVGDLAHSDHMVLSEQLSTVMLEAFQAEQKVKTRVIRQAPFHVLAVNAPSTLIEVGFLTNDKDFSWLTQADTPKSMAKTIYKGLKKFKEKLDKAHGPH